MGQPYDPVPDKDVYELNWAATIALKEIDEPWRQRFAEQDSKCSTELQQLESIDKLTSAYCGFKGDWPFAKIGCQLDPVCVRFEGVMKQCTKSKSSGTRLGHAN